MKRGITNHGQIVEIVGPSDVYPGFVRVRQIETLFGIETVVRAEDLIEEPGDLLDTGQDVDE